MKKLFIIPLLLLIISCSVREKPLFVKVDNMHVVSSDLNRVVLTADAFFINPNDVGGSLESKHIDIIINDMVVAKMSSEVFDVPARKEFSIPLKVEIPTKEIFKKNAQDVLGGLLTSLLSKKINVQYKGIITYHTLGFSYDYEIEKSQEITIKI
ncbi:LEA type 2 family protein [Kordia zhangzhouensis]|uniref:LEA type 2 family protein n=1 Tax=Kordia zhangzhouensis TaxID=1620405 RepID=UPI0006298C5E|nr:LEA type 2 family protein [Kordia zhangzhouensis]